MDDISPSSIGINEEFTVGVQIENCGDKVPDFVSFELINPPIDIEIKEPLILNISRIYYGNSERFITYHMKTTTNAQPGTHTIKTRLSYGSQDFSMIKNDEITINVLGDKAELNIASAKTDPVIPRKGDTIELTLRIENFGEGELSFLFIKVRGSVVILYEFRSSYHLYSDNQSILLLEEVN